MHDLKVQQELDRLKRRLARGKRARMEAEHLLEEKSKELYLANRELIESNQRLLKEIAERRKIEADLQLAIEVAQAAARAKSEFLANMSHEIRTPMNGVIGMTGLLLDSSLDEEQRCMVETVRSSADALLIIINDILDFSKIEAGKLDIERIGFDLRHTVEDVGAMFTHKAGEKGLALSISWQPGLSECVLGDPSRLRQVLTNLIGNAVKFTSEGCIQVRVHREHGDGGGELIRFEVQDEGIGIPFEKLAAMFDKFTQADSSTTRRFGGTGLGLAISRSLVELMGGELGVESEPGVGSNFWFRLPLPPATMRVAREPEEERSAVPLRPLKVLIAEDNPVNQLVARKMLAKLGCTADVAENGIVAVEMLKQGRYDLVLMDCMMPERNGYQACRLIRDRAAGEVAADLPIIAMTANAMVGDREKCLAAGMDDHVAKPVKLEALRSRLARWQYGRHGLPSAS